MTEKLPVKVMLTVIEATDPQPVPNKSYSKMSVKATTDWTGDQSLVFYTFIPSFMEVLKRSIGKSVECDVFLDEHKIVGVRDDKAILNRDLTNRTQTVIRAVADMTLSEKVDMPQDILNNQWNLVRKWQKEALK
jgi:hypothetical protein